MVNSCRHYVMETLQPDPETFEAALSPKTRFVLINTPNNPTGAVYTEESIRMVTDILKKKQEEYGHPIYLVSDEPYRKLAYDIEVPYLTHYYENTIVVYSYSKALSIPGERIGYIAMESCVQDYEDLIARRQPPCVILAMSMHRLFSRKCC